MVTRAAVVAAELLGFQDRVGSLAPGRYADLIAVPGDPLDDLGLLAEVPVVMRGDPGAQGSAGNEAPDRADLGLPPEAGPPALALPSMVGGTRRRSGMFGTVSGYGVEVARQRIHELAEALFRGVSKYAESLSHFQVASAQ